MPNYSNSLNAISYDINILQQMTVEYNKNKRHSTIWTGKQSSAIVARTKQGNLRRRIKKKSHNLMTTPIANWQFPLKTTLNSNKNQCYLFLAKRINICWMKYINGLYNLSGITEMCVCIHGYIHLVWCCSCNWLGLLTQHWYIIINI